MESEALFEIQPSADSWHRRRRVGFDLETTSPFPAEARIVSAALVALDDDDARLSREKPGVHAMDSEAIEERERSDASPVVREWLVDPGIPIPEETVAIHGISTEYAREHGQDPAVAIEQLVIALTEEFDAGSAVVVMNAPYDLGVLQAEAARYGLQFPEPRPVIDPLVVDKQVDKYRRGKRRLGDLCGVYGVLLNEAHSAAPDALATVQVADCLAEKFPELQMPAGQLHDLQVGWRAEQAADFQAYLQRQGKTDAFIDGSWPL